MQTLTIIDHPLIHHKMTLLRDKDTGSKEFRELAKELSALICYEATRELPLEDAAVETPVAQYVGKCLAAGTKLAVVPILRAGLGMAEGLLSLLPTAKVGHIGIYRDPNTLRPVEYYCKLPSDIAERTVLLLDPMLATGGTAAAAVQFLKDRGVKDIKILSLVAAPEGVKAMAAAHPEVRIFTAAYDKGLNDHGYIVPGLGDAGDRIYGTK